MGKIRHSLAVSLCSALFLPYNAAYAFWPVLDLGEIIPVNEKVTRAIEALSNMSGQLENMSSTLKAVGDVKDTVAKFSQNFSIASLSSIVGDAEDVETAASTSDKRTSDGYSQAADAVWSEFRSEIDNLVADMSRTGSNESESYTFNLYMRRDSAFLKMAYADGQATEEAEAPLFDFEQDTDAKFSAVEEELNVQNGKLNDLFDASISQLNQNTEKSLQAMKKLQEELQRNADLQPEDKNAYLKRVEELINRRQKVGDRLVAVAENAKESFNTEFQNVVLDGLSNYRKTVERYNRGDAAREELENAGKKLREAVAAINTSPDKTVLSSLYGEADEIRKELSALAADIKNSENAGDDEEEDE